ncbi:MAG: phosphate butyryltransferase [Firmicutes bacterium]|nr:phosphate butyryltransferase [Bacillota bacterium]
MYKNFVELLEANPVAGKKKVAAVCAHEDHVIEAMIDVNHRYDVQPTLIGHEDEIHMLLAKHNCFKQFRIIQAATDEQAVRIAIDLVKAGDCDVIFKGLIQTGTMMRAIVNHETGICERGVMSHVALMEVPGLNRLLAVTDAALLTYPDVEKKMEEVRNAVNLMHAIGVPWPKVALLACVEEPNPKRPACVDAAEIKRRWELGEMPMCIVEGPISYDLAMVPQAAVTKRYMSPVAGQADILVAPDIQAGNLLVKSLMCTANAVLAGLVIGASVPVILTSRSAPVVDKSLSIAIAAALDPSVLR